jgi:hypothetical protein
MSETLVLYQYFEKDQNYRDNFAHFMAFGYRKDLDFLVILSGENTIELPQAPNIRYLSTPNQNYDYGAFSEALKSDISLDSYENVIFINSSMRGPYLSPTAARESWVDLFVSGLTDEIALFGSTICILNPNDSHGKAFAKRHPGMPSLSHVQTGAYAMKAKTVKGLLAQGFYKNESTMTRQEAITDYEIMLSQIILKSGRNIGCLVPEYRQLDHRNIIRDFNPWARNGDIWHRNSLMGRTVHPYETLFAKSNRILYSSLFLDSLTQSMASAGAAGSGQLFAISKAYMVRIGKLNETYSHQLDAVKQRESYSWRTFRKVRRVLRRLP